MIRSTRSSISGSLVLNNALDEHVRLSVDTENYREKRAESLERLARKMAMKVVKSHRSMTLEPMNPYERRIIHAALQDFNGVTTYSTGTEPGAALLLAPDNSYRNRDRRLNRGIRYERYDCRNFLLRRTDRFDPRVGVNAQSKR